MMDMPRRAYPTFLPPPFPGTVGAPPGWRHIGRSRHELTGFRRFPPRATQIPVVRHLHLPAPRRPNAPRECGHQCRIAGLRKGGSAQVLTHLDGSISPFCQGKRYALAEFRSTPVAEAVARSQASAPELVSMPWKRLSYTRRQRVQQAHDTRTNQSAQGQWRHDQGSDSLAVDSRSGQANRGKKISQCLTHGKHRELATVSAECRQLPNTENYQRSHVPA